MWYLIVSGVFIVFVFIMMVPSLIDGHIKKKEEKEFEEWRQTVVKNHTPMSPQEFLSQKRLRDFEGVYVLHNVTKDMSYVGQSINVMDRARQHFTGKGNGDVYADYKYGSKFEIIIIALADTNCDSLNELERNAIAAFHAYDKGYNKTRGNY